MPDEPQDGNKAQVKNLKGTLHELRGGERLEVWLEYNLMQNNDPDTESWMKGPTRILKLHSWSLDDPKHPKCVFSYIVQPDNTNMMGNLHGGATATLFDFCTTMPIVLINTPDFWWYLGVSRTLNVTYLRPMPVGEKIFIECELVSIGKTMSTIRGVMRRASDGAVTATCEHGKYNTVPPKSKL